MFSIVTAWRRLRCQPWCHVHRIRDHLDGRKRSLLARGGFWFHLGHFALMFQWNFWSKAAHANVEIGGERAGVRFNIALPPVSFSLLLDGLPIARWLPAGEPRTVGFSIHGGRMWWRIWAKRWCCSLGDPWWQHFSWNLNISDLLLGKPVCTTRLIVSERVEVPLPEGIYPATVEVLARTHSRQRWPWGRTTVCTRIKPDRPIAVPRPGPGIHAGAVREMTTPAQTARGAVRELVNSCLLTRRQYGTASSAVPTID